MPIFGLRESVSACELVGHGDERRLGRGGIVMGATLALALSFTFFVSGAMDITTATSSAYKQVMEETYFNQTTMNLVTASVREVQEPKTSSCCYATSATTLSEKFTPEYFAITPASERFYTGSEYADWKRVATRFFRSVDQDDCLMQWRLTVLDQTDTYYLKNQLKELLVALNLSSVKSFPYVEDEEGQHRILYLGDSVSGGTWTQSIQLFGDSANIHGAPTNCGGFGNYEKKLDAWLGSCPWDLIQFNVGLHFRGDDWLMYQQELEGVLARLRQHSPGAKLVIGLTTPTPFDHNSTYPSRESCANYDKFLPSGYVAQLNDLAKAVAEKHHVFVSDRYSAIQPELDKYQRPCDVHLTQEGYQLLAQVDWEVAIEALNISSGKKIN